MLFVLISMMCARSPISMNTMIFVTMTMYLCCKARLSRDYLRILFTVKFISLKCFLIKPNAYTFRISNENQFYFWQTLKKKDEKFRIGDRKVKFQLKCGCFQPELGILQPKWTKQEHCSSHYLVWILDFSMWILLYQLSYVWTMEKRFKCERLSLEYKRVSSL